MLSVSPQRIALGLVACALPIAALASIPKHSAPTPSDLSVKIRVRVSPGVPVVQLRGFDLRIFEQTRLTSAPDRQSEWELKCGHGPNAKIRARRVGNIPSGARNRAGSAGASEDDFELQAPVAVQTPAGFLSLHGRPYRGEIVVYPNAGKCEVINEVDLEKYLDGLVNAEFNAKWSEQGIAAQVIAARTYAYYQMQEASQRGKHFDVDSTDRDQVYDGSIREDFRASRAVEKTRGIVLAVNEGGAYMPLKAFYHSTCGGVTELPEKVWGTHYPGFRRVRCPYCGSSPRFRWELDLTPAEISRLITKGAAGEAEALGWPSDWKKVLARKDLVEVATDEAEEGGRPNRVVMLWRDAKSRSIELAAPAGRVRNWLGTQNFRSTSFKANPFLKGLVKFWHFEGRGNGHGVGMCQWGAKVMGDLGYSATTILKHYYPEATLRKLW
jgi:stage II sporulation protein D